MRLLLDACVLVPPLTRGLLLDHAASGGFTPLWSARILEEWARAAERTGGPAGAGAARTEAALMGARFPDALVEGWEERVDPGGLPDPGDAHVVAAALAGGADAVLSFNTKDFPRGAMAARGLSILHPDGFLAAEWEPGAALDVALSGLPARALKREGLSRLAKKLR